MQRIEGSDSWVGFLFLVSYIISGPSRLYNQQTMYPRGAAWILRDNLVNCNGSRDVTAPISISGLTFLHGAPFAGMII